MKSLEEIVQAVSVLEKTPIELAVKVRDAQNDTLKQVNELRGNVLMCVGIYIEDTARTNPGLDTDFLLRVAANQLLEMAANVVCATKRKNGGELEPARMAVVAHQSAELVLLDPPDEETVEMLTTTNTDGTHFRAMLCNDLVNQAPEQAD